MENKNSIEVIEGLKKLFNILPLVSNGSYVIQQLDLENFGSGQAGFNALKSKFDELDFNNIIENVDLDKQIKKQKKELKELETKYTNLTQIVGGDSPTSGSIANEVLIEIKKEIKYLIEKRDSLLIETQNKVDLEEKRIDAYKKKEQAQDEEYKKKSKLLEDSFEKKKQELAEKFNSDKKEIDDKLNVSIETSNKKIRDAESNANQKVKLINQFKDFLEETNSNMKLYQWVIAGVLTCASVSIWLCIPTLLEVIENYNEFIKNSGSNINNWQIINYAIGLLIVKLPLAICLSAILTGMYSLLKALVVTYETINRDKRNMSAIYSISGNIAQQLNEYGIDLAIDEGENEETEESITSIRVSRRLLNQKKENIRWNQIMKYFEKLEQYKDEPKIEEDQTKLKLVTNILNKFIDKIPNT